MFYVYMYYVCNMPYFFKFKKLLIIKGTLIYVTSTKMKRLPIIMVYHILISKMLKCVLKLMKQYLCRTKSNRIVRYKNVEYILHLKLI